VAAVPFSVRRKSSACRISSPASLAYAFRAFVQFPTVRAPSEIPAGIEVMHVVSGGALKIVRGCDSKTRAEKNTRRRTC